VGVVADRLKQAFLKRFAVTQGGSVLGRTIPFGVGAVVGGTGNHILGRRVVASSQSAFGPIPDDFPDDLLAYERDPSRERLVRVTVGGRRIPLPVLPIRQVRERVEAGRQRRIAGKASL